MKVVAVVPGFSRAAGDASIPALRELLLGWAATGDAVEVLALRHPPGPERYTLGPLQVHTLGGGRVSGLARLALLRRAVAVLRAAPGGRPDVIVGFWADEPGWVAVQAARNLDVPAVVALMGGELAAFDALGYGVGSEMLGRRLRDHALRQADVVTAGSAWLAARATTHLGDLGAHSRRVEVLPLGLDPRRFAPGPVEPRRAGPAGDAAASLRLGVLGNLVPVKNHAALLRSVARLRGEGLRLHLDVAGDGPERPALAALAAALGVRDDVHLRGALPWADVPGWLRGLDLHVLPSRWESQGMATLEAAACGVAVAGSAVGALAHLGTAAARWPADDEAAMTRALRALAHLHRTDRSWLRQRGAQVRAEVAATTSLDVAIATWRAVLAATASNEGTQGSGSRP